jgi:predicted phosphoadenosine phosphosulfate sulfurtransferase
MSEHHPVNGRKIPLGIDVLVAARQRIADVFERFERICLSFSGGKDSTVMLHLVAEEASKRGRRFSILFLDWEVQYRITLNHIDAMRKRYACCTEAFFHICLPITTVNGVSALQPEWTAWEPGVSWVRHPPDGAITDPTYFPFYRTGMTFEDFIPAFNSWFANDSLTAILVGLRADESLNRFKAISSRRKQRLSPDIPWATRQPDGASWCVYPLYDWHVTDIWRFHAVSGLPFNPVYDLMFRAGVSLAAMRICEPFGPEQRKGLWLYHILEPETWSLACERVSGAASGARYDSRGRQYFGRQRLEKPLHHSWQSYAHFLLESLPQPVSEHYRTKIAVYLNWYRERDWPQGIPDQQEGDTGGRDIPSWRRICKIILRNDYWCRGLSFSPTKNHNYKNYMARLKRRREEWGLI